MTTAWANRPPEVANLLNPALLSLLIHAVADGYRERTDQPLPFTLPFIAIPLCINPQSRSELPSKSSTSMLVWLSEHPDVRYLLPAEARDLGALIREAMIFGSEHGLYAVGVAGIAVIAKPPSYAKRNRTFSADMLAMYNKAAVVGKWLGRAGSEASILSAWGVTP